MSSQRILLAKVKKSTTVTATMTHSRGYSSNHHHHSNNHFSLLHRRQAAQDATGTTAAFLRTYSSTTRHKHFRVDGASSVRDLPVSLSTLVAVAGATTTAAAAFIAANATTVTSAPSSSSTFNNYCFPTIDNNNARRTVYQNTSIVVSCESSTTANDVGNNQMNDQLHRNGDNNTKNIILSTAPNNIGLTDETDDSQSEPTNNNLLLQDGMDASSVGGTRLGDVDNDNKLFHHSNAQGGPADVDDENNSVAGVHNSNDEDDDDDDPSMDEETTCSICLINRQGPCRKYWLKFEKCMKEHHGAENDKTKKDNDDTLKESDNEGVGSSSSSSSSKKGSEEDHDGSGSDHDDDNLSESSLQEGWDSFMEKSTRPGEEDDEEEEEREEDEDADDDMDDDDSGETMIDGAASDSTADETKDSSTSTTSLAERCDRHMIPWIECIQRHRNTYSLISNEFYQGDYIDPLEFSIPEERRVLFRSLATTESKLLKPEMVTSHDDNDIDGMGNSNEKYVVQFSGVEIDLESWKEHIDAETDDAENGDEYQKNEKRNYGASSADDGGRQLINASAKFRLLDPKIKMLSDANDDKFGGGRIEVGYIKDQRGRLLGFDSFNAAKKETQQKAGESDTVGECTFHIVPGETTSIMAYAIYRGTPTTTTATNNNGGQDVSSGSNIMREDVLYHTPEIPLPGISTQ